nr:hypothetical protein [uncultured Blautia sp.]
MKRKPVFRIGTILLSAGFVMSTMNIATDRFVMAEEMPIVEKEENSDIVSGAFEDQDAAGASDLQDDLEILDFGEPTEDQTEAADAQDISSGIEIEGEAETMLEEQTEVVLPQKSVFVSASEFVPVLEREDTLFLNPHDGLYLLRFKNEEEMDYTILFNQGVKAEDLALYHFDSEKNQTVESKPVQGVMDLSEDNKVLSLKAAAHSDYVLVISYGENYKELGYTAKIVTAQPQETEAATETESEPEKLLLASVRLELDSDLETVPAAFSEYLKDVPVYSVTLVYSDGSEKLLEQEDERYELSVEYEDTSDADEMVRRTYHAVLKEYSTGNVFEDTQYIDFGKREPVEIKTEEMTTVILEGRKKWIMVQSVPSVTGRYAMNSDKSIEEIYYVADDGEVVRAEDILKLQQGISYQFLIKLS